MSKRFLTWAEFGSLAEELAAKVRSSEPRCDVVVGVARSGIPTALVVADRLRAHIDFINVKSYLAEKVRIPPRILSTLIEDVRDRSILVVDDLVDHGDTMRTITQHIAERHPKTLKTATLFIKPWSTFVPDYYLEMVEQWIVFPWELGEFGPRAAEATLEVPVRGSAQGSEGP